MSEFQLVMPKMGESIAEATIIRWVKNEGDMIAADETVLEIATDKVDSEVPSPKGGKLIKRLFNEGDVVPVGAAIAIIALEGGAAATPAAPVAEVKTAVAEVEKTFAAAVNTTAAPKVSNNGGARFYSPLVLNIAKEENVSMAELENIEGTGSEGRVTKRDILAYVQNRGNAPVAPAVSAPVTTVSVATPSAPASTAPAVKAPSVCADSTTTPIGVLTGVLLPSALYTPRVTSPARVAA